MSWGDVVAILGGFGAGFLSGTIGIGGGLLFVPTMTVGLRLSQAVAQGTSLVAIIPTAIVGGVSHMLRGNVLREPALLMGGGEWSGPSSAPWWPSRSRDPSWPGSGAPSWSSAPTG